MVSAWLTIIVGLIAGVLTFIDVVRTEGKIYGSVRQPYPLYKPAAYIIAPLAVTVWVWVTARLLFGILSLFGIVF